MQNNFKLDTTLAIVIVVLFIAGMWMIIQKTETPQKSTIETPLTTTS
jgi:hypothetical protein